MGSDGCDAEGSGGVSPSSGSEDSRYIIAAGLVGSMVVVIGDGGLGGGRTVSN